jgi:hypothetical protein
MANTSIINAIVKITSKDINGNNVAKQFNQVSTLHFDYSDATPMINIIDVTGSFYFPILPLTTVTYTIVANPGGQHTVVLS